MPAPARPTGPISPSDLLWRHELREQNATLLQRMNALEAKLKEQERRVQKTEEAATACTGMAEDFDIVKDGIDQLETKQQEFMSAVHMRLVDMDKNMEDFRKTQERVQKLMASHQELDDSVGELSSLGPRIEDVEREIQGLKNSVSRKHVHEMQNLEARLEALELQRSREDARIRTMQDDFTEKWNGEFQALRTDMVKLKETRRTASVQQPYVQVPRSPEVRPSAPNEAAPSQTDRKSALKKAPAPGRPRKNIQVARQNAETQGTTQASTQAEEVEDLDLDTNVIPDISPHDRNAPQPGMSPRKKPKLSRPTHRSKPQQQLQQKPVQVPQRSEQATISNIAPRQSPSKVVRLPINLNSKKRPGSPISTPKPANEQPVVTATAPRRQAHKGSKSLPALRERKAQPSQPTRKSQRRLAQATFYELGWDHTQQRQKTSGPVYDSLHKPLKTKPRRLPPVPDE